MSNPIAWMCDANDGANADATASERVRDDYARFGREITPLYAIPDTHRVVPVELLQEAVEQLSELKTFAAIRAIIREDKP